MYFAPTSNAKGAIVPSVQCLRFLRQISTYKLDHERDVRRPSSSFKDSNIRKNVRASKCRNAPTRNFESFRVRQKVAPARLDRNTDRTCQGTGYQTRQHATASRPRNNAVTAHAVEVTEEELSSLVQTTNLEDRPAIQPSVEAAKPDHERPGQTGVSNLTHIMQKVEDQHEQRTTLHTMKRPSLVTRHLSRSEVKLRKVWQASPETQEMVDNFVSALSNERHDWDEVWQAYLSIPEPRVAYLTERRLSDLLALLRNVRVKTKELSERYFTILEDSCRSGNTISPRDVNFGMHVVGRIMGEDKVTGVRKAVNMLKKLEKDYERADLVTFNTLGNLALKAKMNDLVRTVLETIDSRKLHRDRYTWLLRIAYYGKARSAKRVISEYKEMIAAGELVDTVALNCVIKALLEAGDPMMAEKTLERMKQIHSSKAGLMLCPTEWHERRRLGHILKYSAWKLWNRHELRKELQDKTPVAPDAHTFEILVEHHAVYSGDLDRAIELLGEMIVNELIIASRTFGLIFDGFGKYGNLQFSSWTISSLRKVHRLFENQLRHAELVRYRDAGQEPPSKIRIDPSVLASLVMAYSWRASEDEVLHVVKRARDSWDLQPDSVDLLDRMEAEILSRRARASDEHGWDEEIRRRSRMPGKRHKIIGANRRQDTALPRDTHR